MDDGIVSEEWLEYRDQWSRVRGEIIQETDITLYVNGEELVSILATPMEQDQLALGFLRNEGFIQSLEEVEILHVSADGCCVDIWLKRPVEKSGRMVLSSGCGRGMTFDAPAQTMKPLEKDLQLDPGCLFELLNQLQRPGSLYARARGVHTAGLADRARVLVMAEDVGRHNAIDKVLGACMLQGIETQGKILLTTGRISSEMLRKGVHMACPVVASRNSPTSMSVAMARALNITLVGYVRRSSMRVYSHPERLGLVAKNDLEPNAG